MKSQRNVREKESEFKRNDSDSLWFVPVPLHNGVSDLHGGERVVPRDCVAWQRAMGEKAEQKNGTMSKPVRNRERIRQGER